MTPTLSDKFFSKIREDGPIAAGKAASQWLNRKRNQTFTRRAVALANNYLVANGWLNKVPQNDSGPIPWFTYPATAFLGDILSPEMNVFEYGSGFSTMFFNTHANAVVSVEHDVEWAQMLLRDNGSYDVRIRPLGVGQGTNSEVLLDQYNSFKFREPTSGDREYDIRHGLVNDGFAAYATEILTQPKGHFDVVVVDGMARLLTGYVAAQAVADDGFIILDNSDRWQYNDLQAYLIGQGYGRVDFWGPGPVNTYAWCTSFFSRRFAIANLRPQRPIGDGDLGW